MENQDLWIELDGILRSFDQTMSDIGKHRPQFDSAWEILSGQDAGIARSKKA
ncbi:hypothetical protein [Mesorhizobium sp. M0965]